MTDQVGAYVEFRDNGTYDAGHTLEVPDLESGTWSIEGNVLTSIPAAESETCTLVGTHEIDVVDDGNRLEVTALEDACDVRREDVESGLTRYAEAES